MLTTIKHSIPVALCAVIALVAVGGTATAQSQGTATLLINGQTGSFQAQTGTVLNIDMWYQGHLGANIVLVAGLGDEQGNFFVDTAIPVYVDTAPGPWRAGLVYRLPRMPEGRYVFQLFSANDFEINKSQPAIMKFHP